MPTDEQTAGAATGDTAPEPAAGGADQASDVPVPTAERPVFIIGSPRSGTSAIAWALSRHPDLWSAPESDLLPALVRHDRLSAIYREATSRPHGNFLVDHAVGEDEFLAAIGAGVGRLYAARAGGRRWVDQTPRNTHHAPTLARLFPHGRFVHILRDGRAVVRSMVHFERAIDPALLPAMREAGALPKWVGDFGLACRAWTRHVAAAAAFQAACPDRCLTVRNEELSADPAAAFGRVLAFLELPPDRGPAAWWGGEKVNSSFPGEGGADPATLWAGWTAEERATFRDYAGPAMVAWGLASWDDLDGEPPAAPPTRERTGPPD